LKQKSAFRVGLFKKREHTGFEFAAHPSFSFVLGFEGCLIVKEVRQVF